MNIKKQPFGITKNGIPVHLFTLQNDKGMEVKITNFGGIITSLKVPDRKGEIGDIVLGFDNLADYENEHPYFGAIVGRYANRIRGGKFKLEGQEIQVSQNEKEHHLHGGIEGFDKKVWEASEFVSRNFRGIGLKYISQDGEEGFPGNLICQVSFALGRENQLEIQYHCETDKTTVVNLTHHDYFNLKDGGKSNVFGHKLTIFADAHTPFNKTYLPTGEIEKLDDHFADFRKPSSIASKLKVSELEKGFNHNYILKRGKERMAHAADLYEPESGRLMEIWTTQPALQLYTAGYLDGVLGKNGANYQAYHGVCLEGQYVPDSPNHLVFPSTILRAGEIWEERYLLKFKTQ